MSGHLRTGRRGEDAACLRLRVTGYRVLERNYSCPLGEIDIVALKGRTLVFVEVRTRKAGAMVDPMESINDLKLSRMADAARHFMVARHMPERACRFDIVTVREGGPVLSRVRHFRDAFWTTDERPWRGRLLRAWIRRQPKI